MKLPLSRENTAALKDVVHLLVLGRGRAGFGDKLTKVALERAKFAAKLYRELHLESRGGYIITSGYKSPADDLGVADVFQKGYDGVPEAELLKRQLVKEGVPADRIRAENDSIDTVTNLTYVEYRGYFSDNRPVGVVAQRAHLKRIMYQIAPRILRRQCVGIVVPELQDYEDRDRLLAPCATGLIVFGIKPDSVDIETIVRKRADLVWKIARQFVRKKGYNLEHKK